MGEPRLTAGAVYDILKVICGENGKDLDQLAPPVFSVAVESLSRLAKAVADEGGDR